MGGGHSTNITQKAVTKAVAIAITNIIQSVNNKVSSIQTLNVDCNEWNRNNIQMYTKCQTINKSRSVDDIIRMCKPLLQKCGVRNISFKSIIVVSAKAMQSATLSTKLRQDLANKMEGTIKQTTGFFQFGDSNNTYMENVVNSVMRAITNTENRVNLNLPTVQAVNLHGGFHELITFDSSVNYISSIIQKSKAVNESIQALTAQQKSLNEQSAGDFGSLFRALIGIIIAVVGLLIVLGIVLWIIKRNKEKKVENQ
jgi:hypothetical protein